MPKLQTVKEEINKKDYIKLKSFFPAKETINKMKRQPTEWEKNFLNLISDKGLISKVCKEFSRLNNNNNKKN